MEFLLDTHILIWALGKPSRLSAGIQAMLKSPENQIAFSAASIWEIAIKARLGKTDFAVRPEVVAHEARRIGFAELPIYSDVAIRVADLPMHHGDPFDRLLVVQAMAGPMRLLTADTVLTQYTELVTLIG
ncbi:MAG TPA: type II toxin-antitoxin system VapC family toxin [Acetobacteraceae bacterium]